MEEYLYDSFRWLRMVNKLNSINRVRGELVKTYYHVPKEFLEVKLRRNGSVTIEAEDILHFPPHYIASKPGQLMSADLCEGQEPSIVTASMFPSALTELVPSCISQVGVLAGIKSIFRLLKRHFYITLSIFVVLAILSAIFYARNQIAIAALLALIDGIPATVIGNIISEWLRAHKGAHDRKK